MRVRTFRLDVGHDLLFKSPLFQLPSEAVAVLQALHEHLSPHFPISLTDLISTGGQRFSDVSVRASFENAAIAVTAEAISCQFQWVRTEDIDRLVQCQELVQQAVTHVFPKVDFKARRVMTACWLNCEGGQVEAQRAVRTITGDKLPNTIAGGTVELPRFHASISSETEGFASLVDIEDSKIDGAEIFLRLETALGVKGNFFVVEAARAKINDLFLGVLALMDAHFETSAEGES